MKTQSILRSIVSGVWALALAFFYMGSGMAVAAGGDVATVNMTSSAVYWQPHGPYAQITLTVSGPDGVTSNVFPNGVSPAFQAGNLADGSYTYELTVTPVIDDNTRAKLKQARASDDMSAITRMKRSGALPSRATKQSGYFRILNGAILIDQTPEG